MSFSSGKLRKSTDPCGALQRHHKLHHAMLIMTLVRSLLIWKDPLLSQGQKSLMDSLVLPRAQWVSNGCFEGHVRT